MRNLLLSLLIVLVLNVKVYSEVYPDNVIDEFEKKYNTVKDYQCRLHEWCTKGRKLEKRIINYYFKRPRNIRMDILKGNKAFDTGSVGVSVGDDRVTGHRGGILSVIALNVSENSPLATTVRGTTFDESDLQAILERLKFHLENSIITFEETKDNICKLTCIPHDPSMNEGISMDVICIDRGMLLPVFSERYEKDVVVQHAEWSDYIINAGLPEELFKVRYNPEELAQQKIKSIHELPAEESYKFE